MGVFSVSPCAGSLQPESQQVVTVDCVAEQLGNWNQGLLIDISDRDPSDQPDGIPYRLLAEVCEPGESCMTLFCLIWLINLTKGVACFQMAQFHTCHTHGFSWDHYDDHKLLPLRKTVSAYCCFHFCARWEYEFKLILSRLPYLSSEFYILMITKTLIV